jgi:hypothetical protein
VQSDDRNEERDEKNTARIPAAIPVCHEEDITGDIALCIGPSQAILTGVYQLQFILVADIRLLGVARCV